MIVPTVVIRIFLTFSEYLPEAVVMAAALVSPLLPHLIFGSSAIWRLRNNGIPLRELLLGPRRPIEAVSKGILLGLGLVGAQLLIGIFISAVAAWAGQWLGVDLMGIAREEQLGTFEAFGAGESPLLLVYFVLLVTVVAPITEELFFRGYAYTTFRSLWGVRIAVVASAFIFAVIHFYLVLFLTVFVMGILFAVFYERTRSLLSMMVAHSVVNITVTLVAFQALSTPELLT